ncbi:MAG: hypothetical protein IPN61_16220 [Bacteroidetes bacterium]|nr:hypothetical protein [Bacteroidota bacterium]
MNRLIPTDPRGIKYWASDEIVNCRKDRLNNINTFMLKIESTNSYPKRIKYYKVMRSVNCRKDKLNNINTFMLKIDIDKLQLLIPQGSNLVRKKREK